MDQIGKVYKLPSYRSQGEANAVLERLERNLKNKGWIVERGPLEHNVLRTIKREGMGPGRGVGFVLPGCVYTRDDQELDEFLANY
tara:strand:- start:3995 stop:4249 length:255 start_codon:yes stop_codon:yes gene_type:complete